MVSGVQVIEALSQTSRSDEYLNGATPNYFASVRYYTSPLFSIGLTTGFQQLWGSSNGDYYGNKVQYRYNDYFYTLVPEAIFLYTHRKKVQTYFLFGLGISYNDREYDLYDGGNLPDNHLVSGFGPRTQITPFGIKVGDILSGVFEVGFGYKGIINAGLSYKFQSKHAKE